MMADALNEDSWVSRSNWVRDGDENGQDNKLSLRYLDEFIGDLKCSSQMLEWGLFPDAKEVSETMGVFNAIRKLGLHKINASVGESSDALRGGIVVVGDGVTPRTAAMFAYRTKGWTCYSVDPIMKISTENESMPWEEMNGVISIRNKIENVRIRLRFAIVILVHAHVTLEQAMSAINADSVVAVLTLPCCNWYGRQETLFQRHPDIVYDDMSILSTHREIRLWLGPSTNVPVNDRMKSLVGGCIPKHYVAPVAKKSQSNEFFQLLMKQDVQLAISSVDLMAQLCGREIEEKTSSLLLLGNHPRLLQALKNQGFTNVKISTAPPSTPVDIILDPGHLHHALNQTEKTKSGNLVGDLCLLWQTWLNPSNSRRSVIVLSSRRVLRNTKFLNRPSLNWTVSAIPLQDTHDIMHFCSASPWNQVDQISTALSLDSLQEHLLSVYNSTQKEDFHHSFHGIITRIQTLHSKLTFMDVVDASGNAQLVLLRTSSIIQHTHVMPRTLTQALQEGDTIQVFGVNEVTKNGSSALVAIGVKIVQFKSRDALEYYS